MFSAHICGCSFYFMHTWEKDNGEGMTWVDKYDLSDSHWSQKYVSALYFSVITMITVGYGDISPVNYSEKIFVVKFIFFSKKKKKLNIKYLYFLDHYHISILWYICL